MSKTQKPSPAQIERQKLIRRAEGLGVENASRLSNDKLRSELNHPSRFSSLLERDTTELDNQPKPFIQDLTVIDSTSSIERIQLLQLLLRAAGQTVEASGSWDVDTQRAVERLGAEHADHAFVHQLVDETIVAIEDQDADDEQGK